MGVKKVSHASYYIIECKAKIPCAISVQPFLGVVCVPGEPQPRRRRSSSASRSRVRIPSSRKTVRTSAVDPRQAVQGEHKRGC